jgi:hypothetical protein
METRAILRVAKKAEAQKLAVGSGTAVLREIVLHRSARLRFSLTSRRLDDELMRLGNYLHSLRQYFHKVVHELGAVNCA